MHKASTYIALLGALAVAACGDADPAARERTPLPAPAAETSDSDAGAYAAAPPEGEPVPAPGAGAEELAARSGPAPRPAASAPAAERATMAPAPPAETAAAAAVLGRAERAYDAVRSLEADFVQSVTVPLLESTQHSRGKLYIRRPDRFLMKFSEPEGDIVVADGSYFWMYYPSADPKQVIRASVGDGSRQMDLQREFLSNPTERYDAVLGPVESVDGRPAQVVVLTPKGASGYRRVRIWVDREDALVRRFEIVEENESVRLLDLNGLRPNVALGDALFRFTPPPGAQIFSQ